MTVPHAESERDEPKEPRHVLFVEFPRNSKLTRASAINLASKGVPALDNEQAVDEFMQRIAESIAGAFYTSIYE